MKKKSWSSVQESGNGGGNTMPSGAYVVMITGVEDNPDKEFVEVTWDVADGEHKGKFATEWGEKNKWAHSFRVYYTEKSEGLFKRFLQRLEDSNPSFSIAAWEQTANEAAWVGKYVGVAFGKEYYVYDGKKRDRYTFPVWYSTAEVMSGEAKVPDDKYTDEYLDFEPSAPATENQGGYNKGDNDDLPFTW